MKLYKDHPLKSYNTLNVEASALYFALIENEADIREAVASVSGVPKIFTLGGGSNVVFIADFDGLVLKSIMKGIRAVRSSEEFVWIECYGGEEWQALVDYATNNELSGIENLTCIPGSVGAAPVQNVGAYGVEIKDVLELVEAIEIETGELRVFSNNDCRFGYRDSIFKHELKDRYFVTKITIRLSRKQSFNLDYGDLRRKLAEYGDQALSARLISKVISEIRAVKLPDPKVLGNCGSFFKNCIVTPDVFDRLKMLHPAIPGYTEITGKIKIPSGWLIEQCGWKGWRKGDVAVCEQHALILVNYGNATGLDIYTLSEDITTSVNEKFGLVLEREALIIHN